MATEGANRDTYSQSLTQILDAASLPSAAVAGATNAATGAASIVPTATVAREQTIPTAQAGLVPLAKVVDGDTIKARINGRLETIRVIGIDTPELVDRRRPVQCFGREASAKARQLPSSSCPRNHYHYPQYCFVLPSSEPCPPWALHPCPTGKWVISRTSK